MARMTGGASHRPVRWGWRAEQGFHMCRRPGYRWGRWAVGGDDRYAEGHGFEGDIGEAFEDRRENQGAGVFDQGIGVGYVAEKVGGIGDVQVAGKLLQFGSQLAVAG